MTIISGWAHTMNAKALCLFSTAEGLSGLLRSGGREYRKQQLGNNRAGTGCVCGGAQTTRRLWPHSCADRIFIHIAHNVCQSQNMPLVLHSEKLSAVD